MTSAYTISASDLEKIKENKQGFARVLLDGQNVTLSCRLNPADLINNPVDKQGKYILTVPLSKSQREAFADMITDLKSPEVLGDLFAPKAVDLVSKVKLAKTISAGELEIENPLYRDIIARVPEDFPATFPEPYPATLDVGIWIMNKPRKMSGLCLMFPRDDDNVRSDPKRRRVSAL